MDADNLKEDQIAQISHAQSALRRLSNLSNSLALITKIENREFENPTDINLSETIGKMVEEFNELIALKSIEKEITIDESVFVHADSVLIEVLLTNLINNSIRHNVEGGKIHLSLQKHQLRIANSGPVLDIQGDELFKRFKKSNQSAKSMGLGLAIVKKICDYYGYSIRYQHQEGLHTIDVHF